MRTMKKRIIKFNHEYTKLQDENGIISKQAFLLQMLPIDIHDLSDFFRDYDTELKYDLPDVGRYLLLIFRRTDGEIFTTLRKNTDDNARLYYRNTGKIFDIEIVEGG